MNRMNEAKKEYDKIPIPGELSERIQKAVEQSDKKRLEKTKILRINAGKSKVKKTLAAAAAMTIIFTTALNTNTAFAESVSQVPIIGAVARVLTFKAYEEEKEDLKIAVEIPSIEVIENDLGGLETSINQEIYNLCESYADEAIERAKEYRQAFLDTGGTQEEWEAHNIEIRVWYEVKSQTSDYLSLAVMGSESWTSAYHGTRYYNIDLKGGKIVDLKDLLGENYIQVVNDSIRFQIEENEKNGKVEFWTPEEGGFTGITEDTKFFMNEAGNPVIIFDKYEIAPGSEGEIEFEIER